MKSNATYYNGTIVCGPFLAARHDCTKRDPVDPRSMKSWKGQMKFFIRMSCAAQLLNATT